MSEGMPIEFELLHSQHVTALGGVGLLNESVNLARNPLLGYHIDNE